MNIKRDINILIADDHEMFRDGFKLMLSRYNYINLLGEAENGEQLLALAKSLQPDVIITDIKMPIMDGIEATKKIAELYPQINIIGLSMFDEDDLIIDMLEAGAKGYLIKNSSKEQILEAIETVNTGEPFYCTTTSKKLTKMIAQSRFNPFQKNDKIIFNERELEIINFITQELTNKEIADKVYLSVRTIEGIRLKLQERVQVKNSIGLVVYAIKHGWVKV